MTIGSRRSLIVIAAVGIGLRLLHYLRDPSVWHDEAALIVNVLNLDFAQLLGPLIWHEASPPLFLWLERALCLMLGDSTYVLRLIPVLASCLSVVLFTGAARRLLPPVGAFWAVLLFAVSDRLLWHACEAKPYAVDLCLATAILFGLTATKSWPLARRLLALAVVAPLMIFLSYPACFLCGAVLLAVLPEVWREGQWKSRLLYGLCGAAVVCSFAVLYIGPISAQRTGTIEECWVAHFPNWSRPATVPLWSVASTFEVARYAFQPIGNVLLPLAAIGAICFWRCGERSLLIVLICPLALSWIAALVKGYPFGGSRLEIFAAPALALLIAAGIESARGWLRHGSIGWHAHGFAWACSPDPCPPKTVGMAPWRRFAAAGVLMPLMVPAFFTVWFTILPWPRADVAGASAYIQTHRRPDDGVTANHWEYAYYFRREMPDVAWLGRGMPDSLRVWVAFTTPDAEAHRRYGENLASLGRVVERREFAFTTVFLLERSPSPVPCVAQSMPQRSPP